MLEVALYLAVINERFVEYVFAPIQENVVALNPYGWTLRYVALATGFGIAFWGGINIFAEVLPNSLQLGMVLSGLLVGCGSAFLHEIVSGRK